MRQKQNSLQNTNEVVYKSTDDLIPYINNPRKIGVDAINAVASSIKNFGFRSPIIIDEQNEIIAGHTRLLAAKKLGMEYVPCIVVSDLTPGMMRAYRIADNKTGEYAQWDEELLTVELDLLREDFPDFEQLADLTGFMPDDIFEIFNSFIDDDLADEYDDIPEVPEDDEVISQPGYLWELGPHRLLCGDTTNINDVQYLMSGEMANMVFTDPPYNVDYTGKTKEAMKIQNDKMTADSFQQFLSVCFKNLYKFTLEGAGVYICHADSERVNFQTAMVESGWLQKQTIIWVKDSFVLGRQDYHWRHEPILYGWKPSKSHSWYGGRDQDTVWEIKRPNTNDLHPTMKPVVLVARALKNSSKIGDIVLDGFGGGGSTLIAADVTQRVSYMMELDVKYCDVIVKRYIDYCHKENKPIEIKLNGEVFDPTIF